MARVGELLGKSMEEISKSSFSDKDWLCPFSCNKCDGGGNREQTSFNPQHHPKIGEKFDGAMARVVPALCSIVTREGKWVICPRRLFSPPRGEILIGDLPKHISDLLHQLGITHHGKGKIGIWSEVKIRYQTGGSRFDYSFDYIAQRLDDSGQPNIDCPPFILEVMTASTSGSSTAKGTDITSVFIKSLQGIGGATPNINKRQVWGRMGTQLFAKSAVAEAWGGTTTWIVQDLLINELCTATALDARKEHRDESSDVVVFASLSVCDKTHGDNPTIEGIYKIPHGLSNTESSGLKILLPPKMPPKSLLVEALSNQAATTIVSI